jgi:hypothetical protein
MNAPIQIHSKAVKQLLQLQDKWTYKQVPATTVTYWSAVDNMFLSRYAVVMNTPFVPLEFGQFLNPYLDVDKHNGKPTEHVIFPTKGLPDLYDIDVKGFMLPAGEYIPRELSAVDLLQDHYLLCLVPNF